MAAANKNHMGLDTVELLMAIEAEFRIEISDAESAELSVVGNLCDCILRKLRERGETPVEAEVWDKLKALVVRQLGVKPAQITREANVILDLGAD